MRIIVGVIILLIIILLYQSTGLYREFSKVKDLELEGFDSTKIDIVKEEDLLSLPLPVQKYLRYVGVVGKPKVENFHVSMHGEMKLDKDKEFQSIEVDQYSFNRGVDRYFYIKMKMKGVPIIGLHSYGESASMVIKPLGIFKVVDVSGEIMDKAETVTVFNDMCIMAPALLLSSDIKWKTVSDYEVIGEFTKGEYTVSARIFFDDEHRLVNFISEDRYYSPTGVEYISVPWSTPIYDYKSNNGYHLPSKGDAIWHFEDGDFTYIKLNIDSVEYNVYE